MNRGHVYPMLQALLAALLFGASAPIAKLFLGDMEPIPLAAFLYLGSGIGLLGIQLYKRINQSSMESEAQIKRTDFGWLAGAVFAGGVAAPIVMLFSLRNTSAATASLLLNFESVATTLIAVLLFKETISRRALWAVFSITLASILLSINLNDEWGLSIGALGILAACFLWGVDNNFTRNISAKDPLMIVTIKGLGAGSFSLILALILGNHLPNLGIILGAMLLGSLSYGLSIVFFIFAMRGLGAARASALFGTAPLAGMILSFLFFRDDFNLMLIVAVPLTIIGAILLMNEDHEHGHVHEKNYHEHAHDHNDSHHDHHLEGELCVQAHSHLHEHDYVEHSHHHMPDLHHRHIHSAQNK